MNKHMQRDFSKGWAWDKCSNESVVNINNSTVCEQKVQVYNFKHFLLEQKLTFNDNNSPYQSIQVV